MIKIDNAEVFGLKAAIRGMRNPMNSWEKSDSEWVNPNDENLYYEQTYFEVGPNDLDLMKRLCKAGTDHRKFMRMITVYVDITAPLYWWKEFDTYKVGTVANSCSTMHKIHAKEFTRDDFSMEHLIEGIPDIRYTDKADSTPYYPGSSAAQDVYPVDAMDHLIEILNSSRDLYLQTKNKVYWWQMIQLLPSSYNQKRTVMLNYEVLANMYKSRKNHKLDEWRNFCKWIEELPYSELITGQSEEQ